MPSAQAEELAYWGLNAEDLSDEDAATEIWPDTVEPLNLFLDMSTQWRMGPGGVIGLDYQVIPMFLRLRRVPRDRWEPLIDDLRTMEAEALSVLAEVRERDK